MSEVSEKIIDYCVSHDTLKILDTFENFELEDFENLEMDLINQGLFGEYSSALFESYKTIITINESIKKVKEVQEEESNEEDKNQIEKLIKINSQSLEFIYQHVYKIIPPFEVEIRQGISNGDQKE